MTRTITDTADRLRTCDMLTMDDTLRKQTPVRLPRIVLVEGIAACNTHGGCIAVAVADPNSSLSDQPAATLHVNPGYILTWTGDFSHAGSTGFRPGGVDLDQPAAKTVAVDHAEAAEAVEPVTAPKADIDTLMAATACMADRMSESVHAAGMAVRSREDWQRHHRHYVRRMKAMHRLMDALVRAQGEQYSAWRFKHTIMTIADHQRTATKGA